MYISQKTLYLDAVYKEGFVYEDKKIVTVVGTIVEFPQYKFSNNQYSIQLQNSNTRIQIITPVYQKFEYLDEIEVTASVQDVRTQDSVWGMYYKKINIHYTILYPSKIIHTQGKPTNFEENLNNILFTFKKYIRAQVFEKFSSHTSALVLGMLLGEKNELSKTEKDIFNNSQLSHILVVSGYNISLLISFLFWMMSSIHRYTRSIIGILGIILFVLLIGYDASVVRAGCMGAILVIARLTHQSSSAINTLCVVAIIMLTHNPIVLFDAGFHLSLIATYSLLIMPKFKKIPEYFISTIWIFLFVGPYILYMSGSISLFGIITNLSVLFLVPFFMIFSMLSLLIHVCSIYIIFVVLVLDLISRYIYFVAYFSQNVSRVSFILSPHTLVLYYSLLFGIIIFFQNRYTCNEYITKHYQKSQKQKTNLFD